MSAGDDVYAADTAGTEGAVTVNAEPIKSGVEKLSGSVSDAPQRPAFTVPKALFLAAFSAVGAFELAGLIDLTIILARWLTFQGI